MKNIKNFGSHIQADGTVALRIRCVAYPESSPNYADAVLVSATGLTLSINGVADSSVGSSGVLAFATYTTLGKLVDAINLSSNWEAEIVAGLRSDAVNGSELLARSTSVFRMYEEVKLYKDSSDSGVNGLIIALEPNKPFETVHGDLSVKTFKQNRVGVFRVKALVNTSDSGTYNVNIIEVTPDKSTIVKTHYSTATADNTQTDSGQTDVLQFQADFGNCLAVAIDATGWQDSGAFVECTAQLEQSV